MVGTFGLSHIDITVISSDIKRTGPKESIANSMTPSRGDLVNKGISVCYQGGKTFVHSLFQAV